VFQNTRAEEEHKEHGKKTPYVITLKRVVDAKLELA
jgi:hypothetical protein